jgi:hypothetical protein
MVLEHLVKKPASHEDGRKDNDHAENLKKGDRTLNEHQVHMIEWTYRDDKFIEIARRHPGSGNRKEKGTYARPDPGSLPGFPCRGYLP